MKKVEFFESQKFTQWWLWMILFISLVLPIAADAQNTPILFFVIAFLILLFVYLMQLRVSVNRDGIYYQFSPFHLKVHHIKIAEIENIQPVTYSPIKDYGGWGIKRVYKGKAYNIKGNKGVRVELKNGSHILFGSQKHLSFAESLGKFIKS
tara:strand:- start:2361 stop:2813 length:453 start_codon:yes stop_codon:yes gene_type:complete